MNRRRVLAIFIEPTPYIIGLIRALRAETDAEIEILFLGRNVSQAWDDEPLPQGARIMPDGRTGGIRMMWRALRALSPGDVVHLCGWGHPFLLIALIIAKARHLSTFVELDTTANGPKRLVASTVKRFAYPFLFRLPDMFLPGGTSQAAYLASMGVDQKRMRIAHMTVDVEAMMRLARDRGEDMRRASREKLKLADGDVALLFAGRLEPHKGIADLLLAFRKLSDARSSVRLLIAGTGTLTPQVAAAAEANGAITYLGRLGPDALWPVYLAADIFVLPSHFEPWGLVINEAMAFGLPVILSDRAGCRDDLIPEGAEGIVFRAGDVEQLGEAMDVLVSDPQKRREAAEAARARITPWTLQNSARGIVTAWDCTL